MARLHPDKTTILFFDLEAYVPESLRSRPRIPSLAANPHLPGVYLLGGAFCCCNPFQIKSPETLGHWIWEYASERELLTAIYSLFQTAWETLKGKEKHEADLILAGVGIGTFDIPFLYSRALIHEIAPPENLYETFCCCRVLDLASAGIGYLMDLHPIPHPVTHTDLLKRFIGNERKAGGGVVWDMADSGNTGAIEERTILEVEQIIAIYQAMIALNGSASAGDSRPL